MKKLLFSSILLTLMTAFSPITQAATAIFAGGCFWCMQPPYDETPGVTKTVVGYTGGSVKNPTYHQVSAGGTGHYEAVEVFYDPKKVSYEKLLTIFWHNIDPTDAGGQFCDRGQSYEAAIFYQNNTQKKLAIASKEKLIKSNKFPKIATKVLPAKTFYPAESYHQHYYEKNPLRYKFYRFNCGRDQRLKQLWGK